MIVYRKCFLLLQGCLLFGFQGASVGADIVAHQAQGLEHGGPVFQVRREVVSESAMVYPVRASEINDAIHLRLQQC